MAPWLGECWLEQVLRFLALSAEKDHPITSHYRLLVPSRNHPLLNIAHSEEARWFSSNPAPTAPKQRDRAVRPSLAFMPWMSCNERQHSLGSLVYHCVSLNVCSK